MNLFSDGGILISRQLSVSHIFYMFSYSLMPDALTQLTVLCWLETARSNLTQSNSVTRCLVTPRHKSKEEMPESW